MKTKCQKKKMKINQKLKRKKKNLNEMKKILNLVIKIKVDRNISFINFRKHFASSLFRLINRINKRYSIRI